MLQMRDIVFEFSRVTESASLAAYKYIGRGDKNIADDAAVKAMRYMLSLTHVDGEIVIGEGEMDEAPMLYHGERVGEGGFLADIAVDPIDGTVNVANGRYNAIAVIAAAEKGSMLKAPDMYMDKIIVGPKAKGVIDINLSLEENLLNVANALEKDITELNVAILDRERHEPHFEIMKDLGCKIYKFLNGDISMGILTCIPQSDVDILIGMGGAPEGVLAAAAIKALGGDMQGKLAHYDAAYDDDYDNTIKQREVKMLREMNLSVNNVLKLEDLVKGDNFIFSATGITRGDLLEGVIRNGNYAETETLLIRGRTQTIRKIKSTHLLNKKDDYLKDIVL